MSRSPLFAQVIRALGIARFCSDHRLSTAEGLEPNDVQLEANLFLSDLDLVFPGAQAAARHANGGIVAHLEHWPSNPLTRGSYTCYRPGQFTTIAGVEGMPAGNIHFAGEHANSFYEWQGFMEGAALSGIDAAAAILDDAKRSRSPRAAAAAATTHPV